MVDPKNLSIRHAHNLTYTRHGIVSTLVPISYRRHQDPSTPPAVAVVVQLKRKNALGRFIPAEELPADSFYLTVPPAGACNSGARGHHGSRPRGCHGARRGAGRRVPPGSRAPDSAAACSAAAVNR